MMSNRCNKLAAQIIPIVRKIFAGKSSSDAPGMKFQFGERGWSLSPEETRLFHNAVRVLADGFPKVHQKTCMRELQRFCCEKIEVNGTAFELAVPGFLGRLEELCHIRNIVYVEISGIRLELPEFEIGPVRIVPSSHRDIDAHRLEIKDANGSSPDPIADGVLLARVEVAGEPNYAGEVGREQAQIALDCLQTMTIQENRAAFDGSFGFVLSCCEPMPLISCRHWMYSDREPTWTSNSACGPYVATTDPRLNLPLNERTIARIQERGFAFVCDLLGEPKPSPFDEGALGAIRWIAAAIRERDLTRKYLAFYIALEALFSRDDWATRKSTGYNSPAVPVDEGIAFLLGSETEERIRIVKRVRELSQTRNMIVHRGYTVVERGDLLSLAGYSWNCCINAIKMRSRFREESSFRQWFLRNRFGIPAVVCQE